MLGAFEYEKETTKIGVREKRHMVLLENGAKYEGEW